MDNKKYYWLKLKADFFDTEDLILLETMPDGVLYSNILLKLYLKSIQTNGKLFYKDRIPYNSTMLAQLVRHPVGVVEKAMKIFQDMELIEVLDSGAIYMLDIQSFIGQSSSEADRKRVYRDKIKEEKWDICPDIVPQLSQDCPKNVRTNGHQSIENRDKSIENRNKEKNNKKENGTSNAVAFDYSSFDNDEICYIEKWLEYKKEIKKPLKTKASYTTLRNQLLEFKKNGTLKPSIDICIANGWTGLYEQKHFINKQNTQANSSTHDTFKNVERTGPILVTDW
jgi:predicted phage replisome organizer